MGGNFIASLFFDRPKAPEGQKRKRIGKLWYDNEKDHAALLMQGFRVGSTLVGAVPFPGVGDPPYLSGDLMVQTGEYVKDGVPKKEYLWCGHIQSSQTPEGKTIYSLAIEVIPMVKNSSQPGIWLSIFQEDKQKNKGPTERSTPEPSEDTPPVNQGEDPLPF